MTELLSEVTLLEPSWGDLLGALLTMVLLVFSGFASGSEIAFFSLSPSELEQIESEDRPSDRRILALREHSERTLATILITNNLVNVTIIMLCNYLFSHVIDFGQAYLLQFIVITVLLTFLLLLFGEIMPKVYCAQHALPVCRAFSGSIIVLDKVFRPLSNVLIRTGILTEKVIQKDNHVLSVDDLEQALELTNDADLSDEKDILEGIVRFGDETAKEVMTSRQDVVALEFKTSFDAVISCILENNYSRIPVYQKSIDNIRGILYIKDLLPHLSKPSTFRWQSLIRPPYFVPETKMIDDLLRDFQNNKVHIAIVVDEFGGTSGIVTLEDILEEIVGEIHDEYDDDERHHVRLNRNTYIFEGKTLLTDFCRAMKIEDDTFDAVKGDADSLAGLLLELKGDFPSLNEKISFDTFDFIVTELSEHRISRVKVVVRGDGVQSAS